MRQKFMWGLMLNAVILAAGYGADVLATSQSGFSGTTIAVGRFGDIDVANQVLREFGDSTPQKDLWLSLQKTKGPSDLYVQNNLWVPNGSTGWHTHPGHSLIIVTAGTVTAYEGDETFCTAKEYTVGMGFVDPGGDHVHLLRNEGAVDAKTIAVQLIPAGAARRIDAAKPAGCSVL
ncbi:MAG TPA: cupin domain-containing protein [Vicinamibacterales bacterium]|nr:cupin domain-containing protein [Vicinamibacterales bacterium]